MAVLVNGESSSGAEIVAAALQDYRRAVIIGSKTPGDTTVQTIFPISDTDAIKVTTARWLSANRRPLAGAGVSPDIVVENRDPAIGDVSGSDPQFSAALREVQKK
jgi:carboxyl-terminal processing protease